MPGKLIDYQRHLNEVAAHKDGDGARRDVTESWRRSSRCCAGEPVTTSAATKTRPWSRRVQRRMQVLQVETVTSYIEHLKAEPSELDLLFHEFLIGVTEFFRNPEAFDALAAVMVQSLSPTRVPTNTCASGCRAVPPVRKSIPSPS